MAVSILRKSKSRIIGERLRSVFAAYGAALFMVGTLIPIFASLVTVGIFIGNPGIPFLGIDPLSNWYSIIIGLALAIIFWLLAAILYSPFTTVEKANAYSYGLLRRHLSHLYTEFGLSGQGSELIEEINRIEEIKRKEQFQVSQAPGMLQAIGACKRLLQLLYTSPAGLSWALGSGYIGAWRLMHLAEEALIRNEPDVEVVGGALHDELILATSRLPQSGERLNQLRWAVHILEPESTSYFQGQLAVKRKNFTEKQPEDPYSNEEVRVQTPEKAYSNEKMLARMILLQIRYEINNDDENRQEGLIRARNQLLWTIALTGTITYSMVFLVTAFNALQGSKANMIVAALLYMVGALSGLFGRLYNESIRDASVIDDFGLSTTRLIIAPLLSGLAGVGGVLLINDIVPSFNSLITTRPSTLTTAAFTLNGINLLLAGLAGLVPNILINLLQHRTRGLGTRLRDAGSESRVEQSQVESAVTSIVDQQLTQIYHYNIDQARLWFRLSIIAAVLGLITILSGITIILLNGGVLLGIVIVFSGGIPELGAALALQRSKSIATTLNQKELLTSDEQIATIAAVQAQKPSISTDASSPQVGSDDV